MSDDFFPYISCNQEELALCFKNHYYRKDCFQKGNEVKVPSKDSIGYIMKGQLKVYMINDLGDERLMWFLEEKNILSSFLTDIFAKRVVAQTDCEIYYMNIVYYNDYILQSPKHLQDYTNTIFSRYGLLVQQLINAESENAKSKVYKFIYQLAYRYGKHLSNGEVKIENFPSRNDISSITGVHRSNVTRYITELEKIGIAKKNKLQLSITDLDSLNDIITSLDDDR